MTTVARQPGSLTVGPLRPVILKLAAPAVAMMACHFCFNLIDSIWVGHLIGPAALAAVSTAGFYVWVLLSLGEMVEVGLIAVAARRHGEGRPDAAARAAGAAVLYALAAGTMVSLAGFALTTELFRLMSVPAEVASLGHAYAVAGKKAKARAVLAGLTAEAARHYVPSYWFALIHTGLGEHDQALRYLERAYEERSTVLAYVQIDPRLAPLRNSQRFVALTRRLGGD